MFEDKEFREVCKNCFMDIAEGYNIDMFSLGFDANHIRFISDLAKYSEPELRKVFKGISSFKLLRQFPNIKQKYFWGSGLWGRQYYCYSIGSDMNALKNYIRKQKFFTIMQDEEQTSLSVY